MKRYLSSYPELVKEWHPTKNGDLTPKDVTHGSSKKIWWLCSKGHSHYSTVSNRTSKMLQVVQNVQETKLERIIIYRHYFLRLQKNGIQLKIEI